MQLLRQASGLPLMDARRLAGDEQARVLTSPHIERVRTLTQELREHHRTFHPDPSPVETDDLATSWSWSGKAHVLARLGHFSTVKAALTPVYRVYNMPFSSDHFAVSLVQDPLPHVHFMATKPFALLEEEILADEELSAVIVDPWTDLAVWTERASVPEDMFDGLERVAARLREPGVPRVAYLLDGTMTHAEVYERHRVRAVSAENPTFIHHPGQAAFLQAVLRAAASNLRDPRALALIEDAQQSLLWDE